MKDTLGCLIYSKFLLGKANLWVRAAPGATLGERGAVSGREVVKGLLLGSCNVLDLNNGTGGLTLNRFIKLRAEKFHTSVHAFLIQ